MKPTILPGANNAFRPAALVIAIVAAFPSSVLAQNEEEITLAPIVVTAARTPQNVAEVLSDHTVLTSEDIARSGHTSLVDLLQGQRGIEITRNGGPGTNASVFIRGAENKQNIVLVDGVRIGSSTTGGANWAAIPLSQIDRIELVYGPLSSLYGADAIGGVIQIFTKKGRGAPAPTVSFGVGSYDTRELEAGISGSAATDGRFRYAIRAGYEESEGFSAKLPGTRGYNPDKDGYERETASGQIGFDVAKGHELNFSFLTSHLNSDYDNRATQPDYLIQELESYSLSTSNQFSPAWVSRLQLGQSKDNTTNNSSSITRFNTTQDHLSWQNNFSVRQSDLLQVILERREEKVDSTTTALNRDRTTDSMAIAYQLRQGPHLGSVSVRNDDSSQFGSHTTGSIAYGYQLTEALRANASYGTSFRAPTFNELYFPSYGFTGNQPEKGKNAEVGLYYGEGTTQLSAVYYHNRIEDLIVTANPCPGPGSYPYGCAYNVNQAVLTGISLEAQTKTGDFIWRGALDLQNPRDETTDNRLARRATQHGTLGAEYVTGGNSVGTELVFSGSRYDDAANTEELPGYGLLNMFASHEFAPNWTVFGRWNNVFDKEYELAKGYATAGSNVFVGVRYGMR